MDDVSPSHFTVDRISTPIGVAVFVTDERGFLSALDWEEFETRLVERLRARAGHFELLPAGKADPRIRDALARYFDGDIHAVDAIACAGRGTPFQERAWTALRKIAAGTTTSYGELAKAIAAPNAARAVGLANNRNPVAVVVPCHRVIGADGSLTGYAGGLDRKRWLLDHEARHTRQPVWMASTPRASSASSSESLSMRAMSAR
jgi:methylated-DNA-[protein]-cysteine S-methyltransferase